MIDVASRWPRLFVLSAQLLLWRHGWWGPLAAMAVLAAAATWHWELSATARLIEEADAALRAPHPAPQPQTPKSIDTANVQALTTLRGALEPYRKHARIVQHVVATTSRDVQWKQAEFQYSRDVALGLVRLQITAPVTGEYRRLRRGLERALREVPGLSLDQVSFRRDQADQAQVESRLKLSLWLLAPEGHEIGDSETAVGVR